MDGSNPSILTKPCCLAPLEHTIRTLLCNIRNVSIYPFVYVRLFGLPTNLPHLFVGCSHV